jgi:predicted dehydrogenase
MRVLIVGFGSIGRRHCANLRQLAPDAEILVLRRYGVESDAALQDVQVVRSLDEALSLAPDAAIIASPAASHVDDALALARQGVHLCVEKPLSHTLDGVDELTQECQRRSLVLMTAYNLRFYPPLQRLRDALLAGEIGRVLSVRAEVGQYLPLWRPGTDYRRGPSARRELGGGAILELSHEIDYVRWLCGEVVEVYCQSGHLSDLEIDVEDVAEILLRFANGAIGSLHLDMVQQPTSRGCRVVGTTGTLQWDGDTHRVQVWNSGLGSWRDLYPAMPLERNTMFIAELQHFLDCVNKKCLPAVGGTDGRRVLEIALAAKASARESRPVKL